MSSQEGAKDREVGYLVKKHQALEKLCLRVCARKFEIGVDVISM